MRRVQYHAYGGPETMQLEAFELPALKEDEVAVAVRATSVNPIDWKLRQGQLKFLTGRRFPRAMGSDFAGVVSAVGAGVSRFKTGDEVFGIARLKESGAYAEVAVTAEDFLALKPAELSWEQAACLPTGGVMAWQGLVDRAQVSAGQRVFVNGCTGGVGEAVVQVARMRGADVVGSCSADTMGRARELGVTEVLDYATTDVAAASELHGAFDVVFDTAGTLPVKAATRMVKKDGVFLDINATPAKFLHAAFARRHKIFVCTPTTEILTAVAEAATEGHLRMSVGQTVGFEDAVDLITRLESGERIPGKGLIMVESDTRRP